MKTIVLIALVAMWSVVSAPAQEKCYMIDANMGFANNAISSSLANGSNVVSDDIQKLLFTPDAWKAALAKEINCPVDKFPSNWMDRIRGNYDELKRVVENDGKTRVWKERAFQRPVEQGLVKAKYPAKYPGATILKIGSNYKDWNVFKNSLGIPTNRYIRGEILLKIPGRPFCQAQEWVVKQMYKGGGYGTTLVENVGGAGYFVQCP